jgi:hypothetical protein
MLSDNSKKELPSKTWKKAIRTDKRALKAEIFSSNLKIFHCFCGYSVPTYFVECFIDSICCLATKKKELPSKPWITVIRADKRALKAGILSSNRKSFNCF